MAQFSLKAFWLKVFITIKLRLVIPKIQPMDFSAYKMVNFDWIKIYQDKLGRSVFYAFIDKVYGILNRMQEGQVFNLSTDISITDRNRDLFIKVACMYINEGNENYSFSNDYTLITVVSNKSAYQDNKRLQQVLLELENKRQRKIEITE
jgi:hypothetical protein